MRQCNKCQKMKPEADFSKNQAESSGYFRWCKACWNEARRERYKRNPKPFKAAIERHKRKVESLPPLEIYQKKEVELMKLKELMSETVKVHNPEHLERREKEQSYLKEIQDLLDQVRDRGTPWSEEDAAAYRAILRKHADQKAQPRLSGLREALTHPDEVRAGVTRTAEGWRLFVDLGENLPALDVTYPAAQKAYLAVQDLQAIGFAVRGAGEIETAAGAEQAGEDVKQSKSWEKADEWERK